MPVILNPLAQASGPWSGREDLNLRLLDPQSSALTRLRYAPKHVPQYYSVREGASICKRIVSTPIIEAGDTGKISRKSERRLLSAVQGNFVGQAELVVRIFFVEAVEHGPARVSLVDPAFIVAFTRFKTGRKNARFTYAPYVRPAP